MKPKTKYCTWRRSDGHYGSSAFIPVPLADGRLTFEILRLSEVWDAAEVRAAIEARKELEK